MPTLTIPATDGSGTFSAYMAVPEGQGPFPALIVIQEIFGVNKDLRDWCDHFAKQGYLALSPDLFWRQEPGVSLTDQTEAEWAKAFALLQGFDVEKGVTDLAATLAAAKGQGAGKVGCVGFCLGGRMAVLMATRTAVDASVSYYGVGIEKYLSEFSQIKGPLLMHIAEQDKFVPPEVRTQLETAAGAAPSISAHVYPGVDHAFARHNGQHYNAAAAKLANQRTADFLSDTLKN